jgi:radical SAM protein with 4Fe4S-binding SPASM domain
MKAEIKPRINLQNRTPLQEVIPLSTPMVLFVDPASVCNFKCRFCPTADADLIRKSGRWQGLLDFELYKKVIDDLKEFDKPLKVLRLYKEGEPLLHPRFSDMVRYAKNSGCVDFIDTTTNGSLLTREKIDELMDAGIDRINISVDGVSTEQYREFTRTDVDFNCFVDNIRYLYQQKGTCEICVKTVGDILSEEEKKHFYDIFGDISDRVFIENIAPCWPGFDVEESMNIEIKEGIYGQPVEEVQVCPYIFYSMAVNSDGTVSLCFLDWERRLIVGDAGSSSIKDIWNGSELRNHQWTHLNLQRRQNITCASCGQLSHCMPDNLDPFAEMLAGRLSKRFTLV